jgi:hypothetical protein
VRLRLKQISAKEFAEHPDLNLLVAFAEHTLAKKEREVVMAHVAECAGCREQLASADVPLSNSSERAASDQHS